MAAPSLVVRYLKLPLALSHFWAWVIFTTPTKFGSCCCYFSNIGSTNGVRSPCCGISYPVSGVDRNDNRTCQKMQQVECIAKSCGFRTYLRDRQRGAF